MNCMKSKIKFELKGVIVYINLSEGIIMSVALKRAKSIAKKLNKIERFELGHFCLEEIEDVSTGKVSLNAIRIDTDGFKFDREEAHER